MIITLLEVFGSLNLAGPAIAGGSITLALAAGLILFEKKKRDNALLEEEV